jgi:hypothetical protein
MRDAAETKSLLFGLRRKLTLTGKSEVDTPKSDLFTPKVSQARTKVSSLRLYRRGKVSSLRRYMVC